jgi:hypothetical protein
MTVAVGGNVRRSISSGLAATEAAIFFSSFSILFLLLVQKKRLYIPRSQKQNLRATLKNPKEIIQPLCWRA